MITAEECRLILKVHIRAAESCGKMEAAFALTEVLDSIDSESRNPNRVENIYPNRPTPTVDAPKD